MVLYFKLQERGVLCREARERESWKSNPCLACISHVLASELLKRCAKRLHDLLKPRTHYSRQISVPL